MGDIYRTYFQQRGFGSAYRVQEGDYVLAPAQESPRTPEMGHVLTMNIQAAVHDPDRYFLYDDVLDRIHARATVFGGRVVRCLSPWPDLHHERTDAGVQSGRCAPR
jgi:hypothetical protein